MSNPFKEAEKAKKKAPGSKHEPEVKEETVVPVEEPVVQEAPEVQPEVKPEPKVEAEPEEKKVAKPEKPADDIFAKLEAAKKPTGKAYTFYLSDDNVSKLKKMAEKKKLSASKLLDHILSEIL